jgi:hypothetical protein
MAMFMPNWNTIASFLALSARVSASIPARAAFVIEDQCGEPLATAIYGNDGYQSNDAARLEVEYLRLSLPQMEFEEMGFGLSPDGHAWVMLVRPTESRYATKAGRRVQMELARVSFDDLVQRAWLNACQVEAPVKQG